ncbi:DUF397 domain-containing protein [Amycolatopsis sp. NPDC051061]|uniref:DUF397 domain-containing protein n=1 Tax=Amycolatopsis sp. NPDC051061 TaxID=3155042 RepID=UPI00341D09C1
MTWRKSSYSGQEAECVEVALARVVRIRDTKDRPGGTLTISTRSWDALVRGFSAELPC